MTESRFPIDHALDPGSPVEFWTVSSFTETCAHCGGPFENARLTGQFDESQLKLDSTLPVATFSINVRHPVLTIYPCGHRYIRDENRWEGP